MARPGHAAVRRLLDELCVELGLGLPPDQLWLLCESPPADVESVTDAVFGAEGLDPRLSKTLRRQVRQCVGRHAESLWLAQRRGGR